MKKWIGISALLTLTACSAPFSADETEAEKQLQLIAPTGSDARQALLTLEEKGFKCFWVEQRTFAGVDGKNDYLYCDFEKMTGVLISRRWQLALIHKNFVIAYAKFGISVTGL